MHIKHHNQTRTNICKTNNNWSHFLALKAHACDRIYRYVKENKRIIGWSDRLIIPPPGTIVFFLHLCEKNAPTCVNIDRE